MNIRTTQEYFNLNVDQLIDNDLTEYTKEEKLIFDEGLEVVFFDDEKEMKGEQKELDQYIKSKRYEVNAVLKTVNGRISVILI